MTTRGERSPTNQPWVAVTAEDLLQPVRQLVRDLIECGKAEFANIDVRLAPIGGRAVRPKAWAEGVVAVVGSGESVESLLDSLRVLTPSPGLLLIVDSYETSILERAYSAGYLHLRGVFRRKAFTDPDERGGLAAALKEAVRQHPSIHPLVPAKRLGWKISAGDRYPARLVSLVLDRQMRTFMQSLESAVSRLSKLPETPEAHGARVFDAFWEVGRLMHPPEGKAADRKKLEGVRRSFSDVLDAPSARPEAILLEGETGTGKTLVADWISHRLTGAPAVRVSLVNLSPELLETELFGSLVGAFTDAVSRPGVFLRARGRVVFLDEIGDAPAEVQAKLLIYLDHFGFTPRGWPFVDDLRSPVYLVAATNRDLRARIAESAFRPDLYYRFRHRLELPPLRSRRSDLRVLIDFTLQDPSINGTTAGVRSVDSIGLDALDKLDRYEFPGNFRELEDVLARAVFNAVASHRRTITAADIELP